MRNMKKLWGMVCLSLLLTFALLTVNLGATDANAYTNTSAPMSTENLSI